MLNYQLQKVLLYSLLYCRPPNTFRLLDIYKQFLALGILDLCPFSPARHNHTFLVRWNTDLTKWVLALSYSHQSPLQPHLCFCCLCTAAFASVLTILHAEGTFSSRFFDEKPDQNVFTPHPVLQPVSSVLRQLCLHNFTPLTVGVVAGKRGLESGGRLAILQWKSRGITHCSLTGQWLWSEIILL